MRLCILALLLAFPAVVGFSQAERPFTPEEFLGIPGKFSLNQRAVSPLDMFKFPEHDPVSNKTHLTSVEGKTAVSVYYYPSDISQRQIIRNYRSELTTKGFTVVFECWDSLRGGTVFTECANGDNRFQTQGIYDRFLSLANRLSLRSAVILNMKPGVPSISTNASWNIHTLVARKGPEGQQMWVMVQTTRDSNPVGNQVSYLVIDQLSSPMLTLETFVPPVTKVETIASGIEQAGHVSIYDLLFDTNSDVLQKSSVAALAQIVTYLTKNPHVKLIVTGHTDNVGAFDYNVDLSLRRAKSVVAILTSQGISPTRLKAFGVGMAAPIAKNNTDMGRAKNRRVELVEW